MKTGTTKGATEMKTMQLERANSKRAKEPGWVLYGNHPKTGLWFERWYRLEEQAQAYAQKRGWKVDMVGSDGGAVR